MSVEQVRARVALIRAYPGVEDIFVEASGGIELGNAHKYTRTGVDGISIGALTHSAPSMDVRPELIARLPSDPGASGSGNLLVPNKAARLN